MFSYIIIQHHYHVCCSLMGTQQMNKAVKRWEQDCQLFPQDKKVHITTTFFLLIYGKRSIKVGVKLMATQINSLELKKQELPSSQNKYFFN